MTNDEKIKIIEGKFADALVSEFNTEDIVVESVASSSDLNLIKCTFIYTVNSIPFYNEITLNELALDDDKANDCLVGRLTYRARHLMYELAYDLYKNE